MFGVGNALELDGGLKREQKLQIPRQCILTVEKETVVQALGPMKNFMAVSLVLAN